LKPSLVISPVRGATTATSDVSAILSVLYIEGIY